jgi:hypothetical protein
MNRVAQDESQNLRRDRCSMEQSTEHLDAIAHDDQNAEQSCGETEVSMNQGPEQSCCEAGVRVR